MTFTFLMGGREYPVNEAGTRWLADHLRRWSAVDEITQENWPAGADAWQIQRAGDLAKAILEGDDELIELGWRDAEMLGLALSTEHEISGNAGLEQLYKAARRLLEGPGSGIRADAGRSDHDQRRRDLACFPAAFPMSVPDNATTRQRRAHRERVEHPDHGRRACEPMLCWWRLDRVAVGSARSPFLPPRVGLVAAAWAWSGARPGR